MVGAIAAGAPTTLGRLRPSVAFGVRIFTVQSSRVSLRYDCGGRDSIYRFRSEATELGKNTMKKFLLGAVGLVALGMAAPASAADLAARPYTKAPPPMISPIYDWTGFYIGANGGWGESRNCWGIVPVAGAVIPDGCSDRSGGLIGGQIGYRWQANQFVFGLEAQGDWADLHGSRVSIFNPAFTLREGRRGGDEQSL
jgi:hypothetical protein